MKLKIKLKLYSDVYWTMKMMVLLLSGAEFILKTAAMQ